MLHVYAIEPESLRDWGNFRTVLSGFGVSEGRLLSQFPKKWSIKVREVCSDFTFKQKQLMAPELARVKKHATIKSGRAFDSDKTWLENAMEQHLEKPFHAIISLGSQGQEDFLIDANAVVPDTFRWKVPREGKVDRTVEAMQEAVSPLLVISSRIMFVDKFFEPGSSKWLEPLRAFIKTATDGRSQPPRFEYHIKISNEDLILSPERRAVEFKEHCVRYLQDILPEEVKLTVFRWDQIAGGDGLHARYILTNRGGMKVDWGLDTGRVGETTDIALMSNEFWKTNWDAFQENAGKYEFIDKVEITGVA